MRKILPLLPFLAAALLYAEDASQQQLKIREMIQAVQNAPEGERYQKMNEFKQMIRSMNAQKRSEAIAQMQDAMASGDAVQNREQTQTRTRTRTEDGEGEMIRTQAQKQLRDLQNQQSQQQMQQHNQMSNQQQINRAISPVPGSMPQGPGGKNGNRP